jgi:pimeloyl-ACP methyl ester carboxylesterase
VKAAVAAAIFMLSMSVIEFAFCSTGAMTNQSLKSRYPARHFDEISLPSGKTHYQSLGSGASIVLVHGVSGPLVVWENNMAALVQAGFRAVRYDLFGRGFSDRLEHSRYDLDLYIKQLEELTEALKLGPRFRLVGSSFGGIVITEFALRHPDKVEGLVLIGPAGFPITVPWTAKLKDIPILGDIFSYFFVHSTILKQNDHYFVSGRLPDELRPFIADQLSVPGTTQAILSTMKNSPVQNYVSSYQKLGSSKIPVGVIWGRKDVTFPYENSDVLLKAVPQGTLVTIEDSGHLPQYEKFEQVNPALIRFQRTFDKRP